MPKSSKRKPPQTPGELEPLKLPTYDARTANLAMGSLLDRLTKANAALHWLQHVFAHDNKAIFGSDRGKFFFENEDMAILSEGTTPVDSLIDLYQRAMIQEEIAGQDTKQ